jgi:hypothetical protein
MDSHALSQSVNAPSVPNKSTMADTVTQQQSASGKDSRPEDPPKNDQGKIVCKFEMCAGVTFDRKSGWR